MALKRKLNVTKLQGETSPRQYYELLIFAVLTFEFFFLCPGIDKVNIGTFSFYLLSYQELGFNSRFLIGSVYRLFADRIGLQALYISVFITVMLVNALVGIVLGGILRRNMGKILTALKVFTALFLASPFSLSFLYDKENFGIFDLYLVALTILTLFAAGHRYLKWAVPFLLFAASAIHQGFVMTFLPATAVVLLYECFRRDNRKTSIAVSAVSAAVVAVSTLFFQLAGSPKGFDSVGQLVAFLAGKTDFTPDKYLLFAEYYMNVDTWWSDQLLIIKTFAVPYGLCVLLATAPLTAVIVKLWTGAFRKAKDLPSKLIVLCGLAAPFAGLPVFIGNDWDRWISAAFLVQFFIIFYLIAKGFPCLTQSAHEIGGFFQKHKFTFVFSILYLSVFIFSSARLLFYALQARMNDYFIQLIDSYIANA